MWIRGLHEFANILSDRRFASTRIVLHWSQWATTYMDGAEVKPLPSTTHFYPGEGGEIVAHNELLTRYQMAFVDAFSRALVIHVGDRYRVADRNHRWGLAPYHFIDEYYREFLRCAAELGVR